MNKIVNRHIISFISLFLFLFLAFGSTDTGKDSSGGRSTSPSEQSGDQNNLELVESSSISEEYARYVVGTVKNNSNKHYTYVEVEINLYDESGAQVGSTMANVTNLEPYGKWKFKAVILEDNAKRYKIKGVTGF